MRTKILNYLITIISLFIIIIISIYFINEFKIKEIDGKIIEINNETFSIITSNECIYTFFMVDDFNFELNEDIKIKYNKKINNFNAVQVVNIKDINQVKNFEIKNNSMFLDYYNEAKKKVINLSLEEKIGQLLLVRVPINNALEVIKDYHIGGYLLYERDIKDKTKNELINNIISFQNHSSIPLIIAVDEEGGNVSRLSNNKNIVDTPFLSPQELYKNGGFDAIIEDTKNKNKILQELGINVNLAPVADTTSSSSSYMYDRSFGQNAKLTAKYIETVIKNTTYEVSYVLKHFPGYGDNVDTHKNVAIDNRTYKEFQENDFLPFIFGIKNNVQAILVSHNYIQKIDNINPASLSSNIHNILKQDLNFKGIIMTDDLNMNALNNVNNKYIKSLIAGNNIIIVSNYKEAFNEILNGIKNKEISETYIDYLVTKNISWKYYKKLL